MKKILQKASLALAITLLSSNVMAQSLNLKTEFETSMDDFAEEGCIPSVFTIDGNPRLLLHESIGDGYNYVDGMETYEKRLEKLSIINKELNTEKVFTSGPLFEEIVDVRVVSAPKTLKIEGTTTENYLGLGDFYEYFNIEKDDYYYDYHQAVENIPANELKPLLEEYIENHYNEANGWYQTIYNGKKVFYSRWKTSTNFDWGVQYPSDGWIYTSYDNVEYVQFNYTADKTEEIARYNYRSKSAFYEADMTYFNPDNYGYYLATISQNLFNDDNKYEFLLPILEQFTTEEYNEYDERYVTTYEHNPIGYKIVSEDGTVLHKIVLNESKDENTYVYAVIMKLGDKIYFVAEVDKKISDEEWEETTHFYEIKKDGSSSSIQKVQEIRGSMNIRPTVADRNEEITITLNDENSDTARELIITGANGQLVERVEIPAEENSVKVNAAMMRTGLYNFTIQQKGEIVDNGKVIVK